MIPYFLNMSIDDQLQTSHGIHGTRPHLPGLQVCWREHHHESWAAKLFSWTWAARSSWIDVEQLGFPMSIYIIVIYIYIYIIYIYMYIMYLFIYNMYIYTVYIIYTICWFLLPILNTHLFHHGFSTVGSVQFCACGGANLQWEWFL
jgi:hypothetical protein